MRLLHKLLLAFLLTSLLLTGVSAVTLQLGFRRDFLAYLGQLELAQIEPMARAMEADFSRHGSWEGLRTDRRRWHDLHRLIAPPDGAPRQRP
ncbi:hypothetical protein CCR95_00850, partial [Thiocystis minor]|uniref:hypothetical protein n=1 Tax=Thiocystis minor TaxID=61597 RepID=UPI0019141F3A